uniref:Unkown protein n=1 Tax=Riptortus pedestris TaxID=329032 RepID=R4WJ08_RIPPE|nr:unkown protein [Riptortus pedestris]
MLTRLCCCCCCRQNESFDINSTNNNNNVQLVKHNVVTSQPAANNVSALHSPMEDKAPPRTAEEETNTEGDVTVAQDVKNVQQAATIDSHQLVCMPNEVVVTETEETVTETIDNDEAEPQFAKGAYEGLRTQQNNRLGNADPR